MASETAFLARKIQELLTAAVKARGPLAPPIDPFALAELCGVRKVTRQLMVPEGVLQVVEDGFEIFLQDNFANQPGTAIRQRFTLAHELVHTFYYDCTEKPPRALQGAPEGDKLELQCNAGAGQLLVPTVLLKKRAHSRIVEQASDILQLAEDFKVSPTVAVRRLQEVPEVLESNFTAVLIDSSNTAKPVILAACTAPWLRSQMSPPKPGGDFNEWIRPLWDIAEGELPAEWTRKTAVGLIRATTTCRHGRSRFLELKLVDEPAVPADSNGMPKSADHKSD